MQITPAEAALGAGALTAGAAAVTAWITRHGEDMRRAEDRALERDKFAFEREQESARRQVADRDRWSERRTVVHAEFLLPLRTMDDWMHEVWLAVKTQGRMDQQLRDQQITDNKKALAALAQLDLYGNPAIREAATSAYMATKDATIQTVLWAMSNPLDDKLGARIWTDRQEKLPKLRDTYVNLAQQQVGLDAS